MKNKQFDWKNSYFNSLKQHRVFNHDSLVADFLQVLQPFLETLLWRDWIFAKSFYQNQFVMAFELSKSVTKLHVDHFLLILLLWFPLNFYFELRFSWTWAFLCPSRRVTKAMYNLNSHWTTLLRHQCNCVYNYGSYVPYKMFTLYEINK